MIPRWIESRRRLTVGALATVVVVIAGVVLSVTDPFAGSGRSSGAVTDNGYATSSATVTERSLSSQTEVDAILGYAGSVSVAIPTGTSASAIAQAKATASADEQTLVTDEATLATAESLDGPQSSSTLLAARTLISTDAIALYQARGQFASDQQLGCPAASSATVTPPVTGGSTGAGSTGTGSTGSSSGPPTGTTGTGSPGSGSGAASGDSGTGAPSGNSGATATSSATGTASLTTASTTQPAGAPLASTGPVNRTTSTSTVLTGHVASDGAKATYSFEYGTSVDYGHATVATSAGSATSQVSVSVPVSALSSGQTYHYRLVAANSVGVTYGQDATFETTAAPVAVTGSAASATTTSETLSGTVDPGGADTKYSFEWGRGASFGGRTAVRDAGGGSSPSSISEVVTGLAADTTYDYALVAMSGLGTSVGVTQTFQTAASSCVAQQAVVKADAAGLSEARDALAVDKLDRGTTVAQDDEQLAAAKSAAKSARLMRAADEATAGNPGATLTWLPSSGKLIDRGEAVYSLDRHPVSLFYGALTPYRALYLGVSDGPDVTQLQRNLIALGFGRGITAGSHFSAATETAIKTWQASIGVRRTGIVRLGDVVVEPGPVEVDAVTASRGEAVSPGLAVLTATSRTPIVTIALDASLQSEVKVGDPVTITLPDNSTTPGVVSSVGKVATAPSSAGNSGSGSSATVTVDVTPSDPKAAGDLDQAPVEVSITTASVAHALVVPVSALLALASGGYALEAIGTDGVHHLVAVNLGLFDDAQGVVQVSGAGVRAGQRVVVPAP